MKRKPKETKEEYFRLKGRKTQSYREKRKGRMRRRILFEKY